MLHSLSVTSAPVEPEEPEGSGEGSGEADIGYANVRSGNTYIFN